MPVLPYNVKQKQPYQRNLKVYLVAGAITQLQGGIASLEGTSARAMTLASPSVNDDGAVLHIVANTAQAHTVTYTPGFSVRMLRPLAARKGTDFLSLPVEACGAI